MSEFRPLFDARSMSNAKSTTRQLEIIAKAKDLEGVVDTLAGIVGGAALLANRDPIGRIGDEPWRGTSKTGRKALMAPKQHYGHAKTVVGSTRAVAEGKKASRTEKPQLVVALGEDELDSF